MHGNGSHQVRRVRPAATLAAAGALVAVLALPLSSSAEPAGEKIVVRDHDKVYAEHVTDDVCGDVSGGQGLRSGTFYNVENGHTTVWIYPDRIHLVDVEQGTYWYDFDDPTIPDVSGYRYSSPTSYVLTRSGNENFMQQQIEFNPGNPDGIRIQIRISLHWQDGAPVVERDFFNVTGCPA